MGLDAPQSTFSAIDYLACEVEQPERHELLDGEVFAMGGAEDRHVTVTMNSAFGQPASQRRPLPNLYEPHASACD